MVTGIMAVIAWGWITIDRQADDLATLSREAHQIREANDLLIDDQRVTAQRMTDLAIEIEGLSRAWAASSRRRDEAVGGIVIDTPPGEAPDTALMRDRANGMNAIFDDIERISGGSSPSATP